MSAPPRSHVNVPKCVCVAIKASTGKAYNSNLKLSNECFPYFGDTTFRFLGAPVSIHATMAQTREHLIVKLSAMLQKVDKVPITRQQKLPSVLNLHGTLPPQTFPSHGCKTTSSQLPPDFSRDRAYWPSWLTQIDSFCPRLMVVWSFPIWSPCTRTYTLSRPDHTFTLVTLLSRLLPLRTLSMSHNFIVPCSGPTRRL